MTPTQRQAMEMALKWLESGDFVYPTEIADNLRAALAKQDQSAIKLPPMPDDLFQVPGPIWGHILDWHEAKPGKESGVHVKAIENAITEAMNDHAKAAVRLNTQADDKADMTIKLPPMPEPHTPPTFATAANTPSVKAGYELGGYEKTPPLFDEHQMEAYAREAVRLNIAAERERCATIADYAYSGEGPAATAARLVAARIRA